MDKQMVGWTDSSMDGWTNGWTNEWRDRFPLYSKGHVPVLGHCPKKTNKKTRNRRKKKRRKERFIIGYLLRCSFVQRIVFYVWLTKQQMKGMQVAIFNSQLLNKSKRCTPYDIFGTVLKFSFHVNKNFLAAVCWEQIDILSNNSYH